MADLEDGEIDSDCEVDLREAPEMIEGKRGPSLGAASISGYRNRNDTDPSASSSDSEDDGRRWKKKRIHTSRPPAPSHPVVAPNPFARKINNIWGSVVQEQSQEAVAAELGIMGMEGGVSMSSRQSETYNYVLAQKMMAKECEEKEQERKSALDRELERYMEEGGQELKETSCLKRKRPVKERLGPRAEMDFKGRYDIKEDDPEEKVPKTDLIERVVRVIGNKKAIELLSETATDGSRRRTPGGVYLNLLKNTPSISKKQVKEIFYEENQKESNSKKAAKQRRRRIVAKKMKQAITTLSLQEEDDDVSRETFASDTEEALVSLEEALEGPSEDNPAVYNSVDLEVF
ncbi:hypothetical protein DNTS_030362 [Danionella cerebrum]|uniref:Phosphorylated adapter RNA export protein n=1 Tax=Danionella cerebrum TaxID=2873325 RepID=A0A553MU00_9TELE|nr:hypothetical protein DNTS_030362 [Danionella translucida]